MNISKKTANDLLLSFYSNEGLFSIDEILEWINFENKDTKVELKETIISDDSFWFYDKKNSIIKNKNDSFFIICGIKNSNMSQPIFVQDEVGYLGFIAKRINGIIHFLMQAKIEPGNVNKVQISPTIQATKSNFTQRHGGRAPFYLDYFRDVSKYEVICDSIEPEQCSRFYKKYNRNVIVLLNENDNLEIMDHFRWMTIGQLKYFANNYDNLINMDARTVLSCIPYDLAELYPHNSSLINSILGDDSSLKMKMIIYNSQQNNSKALLTRLDELDDWVSNERGIFCKENYPFCFKYFDIVIDNREVTHWMQPLSVANGKALFALAYIICDDTMYFLIKIHREIGCEFGCCFAPTIQLEAPINYNSFNNEIEEGVFACIKNNKTLVNTTLSEEGGRFYHEGNQNIICKITNNYSFEELKNMGYYAVTYKTIRRLIENTHMVNIQLRNLLSLLVDENE